MYFEMDEYYFYRIAQTQNITKASEEIHISQPALSKAVARLEKKLDCKLFFRNQKGVRLTPAGEVLFDGVRRSMEIMNQTVNQISRINYSDYGEINIGGGDDLFTYFMIPVIREYHSLYPNVIVKETLSSNSEQTIENLLQKQIDIGLLNRKMECDQLEFRKICELHEVVVVGERYAALAKLGNLEWGELTEFPILLHPRSTHTRKRFDDKMKEMGVQIKASLEVGSTPVMIQLALEGFGLAVVSKEIAQMDYRYERLTELPMSPPLKARDTFVAWNRERKMPSCFHNLIECIYQKIHKMEN
ncbi:MAG: LysR family transcriptional regulator [Lachnospiraceae bacterium]|jgi:DNA-binding transcriptional LysR family regulator|nr:LysR family transcriptional regulator [Lachnospiraceae bacterium]